MFSLFSQHICDKQIQTKETEIKQKIVQFEELRVLLPKSYILTDSIYLTYYIQLSHLLVKDWIRTADLWPGSNRSTN